MTFDGHQKELVNHLMNGGKVQWCDMGGQWRDSIGSTPDLINEVLEGGGDFWRKKPKTKTTYLWVVERADGRRFVMRRKNNPWVHLYGTEGDAKVYKIEESRKEIEVGG